MQRYRVHIIGVDPGHEWIMQFVADLGARGVPTTEILYHAAFRNMPGMHFVMAAAAYDAEARRNQQFACTVHLLLHPMEHKWYLCDVANAVLNLAKNPRAILIYDKEGLSAHVSDNDFPSCSEVDCFLRFVESECGKGRIFSRDEALDYIGHILLKPSSKEVGAIRAVMQGLRRIATQRESVTPN